MDNACRLVGAVIFVLGGAVLGGAACSSDTDESGNQERWCELTIRNTAAAQALSDSQLEEWVSSSPLEIRGETGSFVVIAQELRQRIADAAPEEQQQAAGQALAEMFTNPEFQLAGETIEQYAFEHCPLFEG